MGNLELERTSHIGFCIGKILRKTFLQFFSAEEKNLRKKNNLVKTIFFTFSII
jgi:hypothetical protein